MTSPTATTCAGCSRPFNLVTWRYTCPETDGGCANTFCSTCIDYAVVTEKTVASANSDSSKWTPTSFCKECFKRHSSIDFSSPVEVMGPAAGHAPAIVFVHGGGGCRTMFLPHMRLFVEKGYRCVALDLPGHGACMDVELTLETAIEAIINVTKEHAPSFVQKSDGVDREIKPIYFGGSLGGYLGMEILGRHPEMFSAAVIAAAGQNVGVGAGLMARMGLFALGAVGGSMGSSTLMQQLVAAGRANGHISDQALLETNLRPGVFFHSAAGQIATLKQSNPRETLPKFMGPVLFVNGHKDHHDSEMEWLRNSAGGKLVAYEDGDHFFTHDERFMETFVNDCLAFLEASGLSVTE